MNWIFEAYANVYRAATGIGQRRYEDAASAKSSEWTRHDNKSARR